MIRVFGSSTCGKCQALVNGLKLLQLPYEYVDAFADETQTFCDEHNISDLPHVQITEANSVTWQKAGAVTLTEIVAVLKKAV